MRSFKVKNFIYGLIVLLGCELWLTAIAIADDDSLLIGVFPRRNAVLTMEMFKPMADYLSEKTGKKIQVVTAKNFPTFWENVMQGQYDIVHYNQLHYLESKAKKGYQVIVQNEEFGARKIRSVLVVRKDSGINSVEDLKGKTIVFGGGKKAFVSYAVNVVVLNRAGLNKDDYVTKFAKNPPNAAIAIFLKQGDAAGIGNVVLKLPVLKKRGVDVSQLKTISVSEALPHLPWAVNKSLGKVMRDKIQAALLSLNNSPAGKKILKKAALTGIHKATHENYQYSRQLINQFRAVQ